MEDLIKSVRQRYGHFNSYRNFSTLAHRIKPTVQKIVPEFDKKEKGFFSNFIRPQITNISQKLRSEIGGLLESREKIILQTVGRDIPRLIQKHTQPWKAEGLRTEQTRLAAVKRVQKQTDLFIADTGVRIGRIQRELEQVKIREKARQLKCESEKREDLSLSHKSAKRLASEYAERERADLRREIGMSAEASERRVLRRLRDEEEYEKRRRG